MATAGPMFVLKNHPLNSHVVTICHGCSSWTGIPGTSTWWPIICEARPSCTLCAI